MVNESNNQGQPDPSEATDGSQFGEKAADESLPGTVGFPPTAPVGVGPADSLQDADHHDSVRERSQREEPEGQKRPRDAIRLVDPNPVGGPDVESELLADDVAAVGLINPEEAAVHIEDD